MDGVSAWLSPGWSVPVGSQPEITFVKPAKQSASRVFIAVAMNVARWACVPSFLQLFLHQRSATITTLRWFHDFCISHAEPRPSLFRFGLDDL
jgi:hypothetical protein